MTKKPAMFSDPSSEYEEPSTWIRWGKIGDWIYGTYIDKIEFKDDEGGIRTDYLLLVKAGEYHDREDPKDKRSPYTRKVELQEGDEIRIGGKDRVINGFFKKRELGDIVGLEYVEDVPSKNPQYSDWRRIKCRSLGEVNKDWLKNQGIN